MPQYHIGKACCIHPNLTTSRSLHQGHPLGRDSRKNVASTKQTVLQRDFALLNIGIRNSFQLEARISGIGFTTPRAQYKSPLTGSHHTGNLILLACQLELEVIVLLAEALLRIDQPSVASQTKGQFLLARIGDRGTEHQGRIHQLILGLQHKGSEQKLPSIRSVL